MRTTAEPLRPEGPSEATVLGQPRGLVTLFFTEMWERFSYYGMRALLVIYLVQHFLFSPEQAQGIYGAYAALVYLMPVLGGFLADRYLGARKAVTIGAVLLVLGHFGMAFEGGGAQQTLTYQGQTYDITREGRGAESTLYLEAEGARSVARFDAAGLSLAEPIAGLPPTIPAQAYSLGKRSDAFSLGGLSIPFEAILFLSLALISAGVGFLKANISTTVGALYAPGDPRRDRGFTIFYMGINLGSLMATLACGYLGQTVGWWAGFGLAGVGMLLGLLQYLAGQKHLRGKAEPPKPLSLQAEGLFWLLGVLLVPPLWLLLQNNAFMVGPISEALGVQGLGLLGEVSVFTLLVLALFFGVLIYISAAFRGVERSRMLVAWIMILFSVVFWALFEQAGSSLSLFAEFSTDLTIAAPNSLGHAVVSLALGLIGLAALGFAGYVVWLFAQKRVDAVILGYCVLFMGLLAGACALALTQAGFAGRAYAFTAAMTQSFNPGFVVLLALPVASLWSALGKAGREPSTPVKFGWALVLVGLGFFVLVAGVPFADAETFQVPLLFLLLLYLFHTTGELFLSPVGLSMVTKLSAPQVVGLLMGVWFLASSVAHIVAAQIAQATGGETVAGAVVDPEQQLALYVSTFTTIGAVGAAAGVVVLAISPWLKHGMHGVR